MNSAKHILKSLRSRPGIKLSRQPQGSRITVETSQEIYVLTVIDPAKLSVSLTGTDRRFRSPVFGQFTQSNYDIRGDICLKDWIAEDLRMQITFANAVFSCPPAKSARIEGPDWFFDVF